VLETKSKLENQLRETRQKLQETEQKLRQTEEEKNNIGDEIISLHVNFYF
jgi:flagellar biosynthesis chaperone FliJ